MGHAAAARNGDGRDPQGRAALIPNFDRGEPGEPLCAAIAEGGIRTASDMIRFNGALITDIIRKRMPASDASQINSANRITLQSARMQQQYGRQIGPNGETELVINDSVPAKPALTMS
jgi:hypothetical protein